jgi:hypothetical protein
MTKHGLSLAERFWMKVDRRGPEECWPWTASTVTAGYGQINIGGGQLRRSNRIAYELTHGPIPPGVVIRHTCDWPLCSNPAHLISGSQADNCRDMRERGRATGGSLPGEQHPQAKLTAAAVTDLRRRRAECGTTYAGLAAEFGISRSQAARICKGQSWAT